jgi:importin-7
MYELVDSLTFKLRTISSTMWPVFELTYKLFKSDAVDFLDGKLFDSQIFSVTEYVLEMLPSLDNFVSFGSDVFKARPDYRQMALDIYTTSVNSEHLGENDAVNGCKLAESLLLNLRGHFDEARSHPLNWKMNCLRITIGPATGHCYCFESHRQHPDQLSASRKSRSPY